MDRIYLRKELIFKVLSKIIINKKLSYVLSVTSANEIQFELVWIIESILNLFMNIIIFLLCLLFHWNVYYNRYTQPPADLFSWYSDYLEDEEEVDVKAGGGQVMKMGDILKQFLTKLEWFSTLFPRIPVPIQKELEHRLAERFPQQTINARNAKPPITLNSHGKYSNNSASGRRDNGNLTRNQQPRHIPDNEAQWGEAERASHWRARCVYVV